MKVAEMANDIYMETPATDTSLPAIAHWLRANIGRMNTMLYEDFYIDQTTYEIVKDNGNNVIEEIGVRAASILKMLYKLYRTELDIRQAMNDAASNSVIHAQDADFTINRVDRSQVLRYLAPIKKDLVEELNRLVHDYRSYNGAPAQVAGDDFVEGHYIGYSPSPERVY